MKKLLFSPFQHKQKLVEKVIVLTHSYAGAVYFICDQNEIKKEVERRKMGKDMLDFKRKQEEEKTKRLLEERNKEKAEEKAARERVKQQIALVTPSPALLSLSLRQYTYTCKTIITQLTF